MSKTKLTGISPHEILDVFGSDAYRYYFLTAIRFGQDGSFSWEEMAARYKSELSDQLGNLASRLTAMVERYRDGVLPAATGDEALSAGLQRAVVDADAAMLSLDFQSGIGAVMQFVRAVNNYVTEHAPWQVAKDPGRSAELDAILYSTADALRACAVLLHPVMPKATERLWTSLGARDALGSLAAQRISDVATTHLPAGARLVKGEVLFPRIDEPA
jgi:methionyl-tRNA synthetase